MELFDRGQGRFWLEGRQFEKNFLSWGCTDDINYCKTLSIKQRSCGERTRMTEIPWVVSVKASRTESLEREGHTEKLTPKDKSHLCRGWKGALERPTAVGVKPRLLNHAAPPCFGKSHILLQDWLCCYPHGQAWAHTEPMAGFRAGTAWRFSHRRAGLKTLTSEWPAHELLTFKRIFKGFNSLAARGRRTQGEFCSKGVPLSFYCDIKYSLRVKDLFDDFPLTDTQLWERTSSFCQNCLWIRVLHTPLLGTWPTEENITI